ncbi:hypothetical protein FRC01_008788, partial [Tulasnella sp. 417]
MTSIHSLPPELLRQVFHWATYEYALAATLPSWKNYVLTHGGDGEDPWPMLYRGMERERTIPALRLTCARWAALATEFELLYIVIHDVHGLKYYLRRIRKLLHAGGEEENQVNCPVRIMNLRVIKGWGDIWTEEDTEMVVSLVRDCPNLEAMVNQCYTESETHAAGPIILQSLANSCLRLKRLHWKPKSIMRLAPSSWSSILAPSSLASSLEVLEIASPPPAAADIPTPAHTLQLELQSLHCLQVSLNKDNALLASVIAGEWRLPSLTSLYLQSIHEPIFTFEADRQLTLAPLITSLISTHGQSVTTLAVDRRMARHIPLHILPPARIQELVYYIYGLKKPIPNPHDSQTSTPIPFAAISTLVLLIDIDSDSPLNTAIWRALPLLRIVPECSLPKLKRVVVLSLPLDKLKEPYPIDARLLKESERL